MTDIQMEERSSKKKLLVPIVVLMLCAVSVIGAGYAYTTSVTNNGNQVTSDYYAIDLYQDKTANSLVTQSFNLADKIHVYSEKTVGGNIVVKAAVDELDALCHVAVFDNGDTPVAATVTIETTLADNSGDGWTVSGNTLTYSSYGLSISFAVGTMDSTNHTYPVTITVSTTDADGVLTTFAPADQTSAKAAVKAVTEAINGLRYNITFSSTVA